MARIRLLLLIAVVVLGVMPAAHSAQAAAMTWRCANVSLPETGEGELHGWAHACVHDVFAHYYTGVPDPSNVKSYGYVSFALCRDSSCTTGRYETTEFELDPLLRRASVHVSRPSWSVDFEVEGTGDPEVQYGLGLPGGAAWVSRHAVGTATITSVWGTASGPVDAGNSALSAMVAAVVAP